MKRTTERLANLDTNAQSSVTRTREISIPDPSTQVPGYYQSSARADCLTISEHLPRLSIRNQVAIPCCTSTLVIVSAFLIGADIFHPEQYLSLQPVLVIIIAYLSGSIPFGYLIVRAKEGADVRTTGSGGTGATNVSRSAGKAAGVLTLMLDASKGAAAVLIATWILAQGERTSGDVFTHFLTGWGTTAAALAVMLGHIFPIWLRFRGGKGVATLVGVFVVLMPAVLVIAGVIFVVIVLMTRYVSLGSIVAALAIPHLVWLRHVLVSPVPDIAPMMMTAVGGSLLIVFAHRQNIVRLLQGTESKFK